MQETRRARLQAVILQELSMVVPREVKDPRVPPVTFTSCEVTPDGSQATVLVMILGGNEGGHDGAPPLSEKGGRQRMKDCLEGLASAQGFLRRHLARALTVRHVPTIIFKEDRGLENTIRVQELLKKISTDDSTDDSTPPATST